MISDRKWALLHDCTVLLWTTISSVGHKAEVCLATRDSEAVLRRDSKLVCVFLHHSLKIFGLFKSLQTDCTFPHTEQEHPILRRSSRFCAFAVRIMSVD